MRHGVWVSLLVACWGGSSQADVVVFKSGDRLTGKVLTLSEGKLEFEAAEVGKVTLDLARIESFQTDQPVDIHLLDSSIIKTRVTGVEDGRLRVEATDVVPATTIDLAALKVINPSPKPAPQWTGSVVAGLTSTHGNSFTESGSLSFDANRRGAKDRVTARGLYLVSRCLDDQDDKETTEETLTLGGKYDYFFTKKFYGFANADYKKDHIADLDYRLIGGLGVGYQWIESEKLNFSTDAGVAELCEKYTRRDPATWERCSDKSDELSGQLGYHFDWALNSRFSFLHNLRHYPSFGEASDYFLTADWELQVKLNEALFGSLKALWDYDATPAPGVQGTDTKYIAGVGLNF
jgi:putative salt-induced outer membrane protein YdiY